MLEDGANSPLDPDKAWLVVGLGNPGPEYEFTHHNLGFLTVDRLAARCQVPVRQNLAKALVGSGQIGGQKVHLAKPQTYMNLSGLAVKSLLGKLDLDAGSLIVVYDDVDLPWTGLRIRVKGSAGGHHGMESIIRSTGTNEFARVRLGIHPGHPIRDGAAFVLSPFRRGQLEDLEELLDFAADAVSSIITAGVDKAMTIYNRRARGSEEEK
jgi:peptidyl-tRNA hydrolase, PTH1 family